MPWPRQALPEMSAGHEDAAAATLSAARSDALSNDELDLLRDRFGLEA
jgi:hypothetical protein